MKKLLLLLASTCSLFFTASDQASLSVKAGVNFSSNRLSNEVFKRSTNHQTGYTAGLSGKFNLSDNFFLQPEAMYSRLNSEFDYQDGNLDVKYDYLTLRVRAGYNINKLLHIHAGPQIGFLLSREAKRDLEEIDLKKQFASADIGATVGAGIRIQRLNFDLRYYMSLNDLNEKGFLEDNTSKIQNQFFQFLVGYRIF